MQTDVPPAAAAPPASGAAPASSTPVSSTSAQPTSAPAAASGGAPRGGFVLPGMYIFVGTTERMVTLRVWSFAWSHYD